MSVDEIKELERIVNNLWPKDDQLDYHVNELRGEWRDAFMMGAACLDSIRNEKESQKNGSRIS